MKKTVLITGACGGIGQALCREFAAEGWDIAMQYCTSTEKGEALCAELAKQYAVRVALYRADLSSPEDISSLAQRVQADFGAIGALINNAGLAYQTLFQLADEEKVSRLMAVNLTGAVELTRKLLPTMISAHEGRIINISSMWGISGASCEVDYSLSKSALIGFTKALAKEVGPSGITVNCIAPGFIDTKMNAALSEDSVREIVEATPMGRKGTGEDVAALAAFLAGERAGFITGQVISVDGGFC
ncbi:MAG: SDR family oxidoreductase [Oscillospiraceae bacterium]|nr:SDR family oxidoreductase [Oscillospiraceae bacterium]MDD6146867.1 SDR family oxidoreductase [Oscillospiraceae bacterium]